MVTHLSRSTAYETVTEWLTGPNFPTTAPRRQHERELTMGQTLFCRLTAICDGLLPFAGAGAAMIGMVLVLVIR